MRVSDVAQVDQDETPLCVSIQTCGKTACRGMSSRGSTETDEPQYTDRDLAIQAKNLNEPESAVETVMEEDSIGALGQSPGSIRFTGAAFGLVLGGLAGTGSYFAVRAGIRSSGFASFAYWALGIGAGLFGVTQLLGAMTTMSMSDAEIEAMKKKATEARP